MSDNSDSIIVKMADRHAKMRAGEEEYMQECLLAEIQHDEAGDRD